MTFTPSWPYNLSTSRYSDLTNEPIMRPLCPIDGYQDYPLISLEEAVRPISHYFDSIEKLVQFSKHNCTNPRDGLTQDESAAIHLYTMQSSVGPSLYMVLNELLRAEHRDNLKPWFLFLKLFITALHKLPSCRAIVYRGVRDVDLTKKYSNGQQFPWWGVSSCTRSLKVVEKDDFLGKNGLRTLFNIECYNGKSIESHSYFRDTEEEVVLMPGSYFKVVSQCEPAEGLHIIHIQELRPPHSLVTPLFIKGTSTTAETTSSKI